MHDQLIWTKNQRHYKSLLRRHYVQTSIDIDVFVVFRAFARFHAEFALPFLKNPLQSVGTGCNKSFPVIQGPLSWRSSEYSFAKNLPTLRPSPKNLMEE